VASRAKSSRLRTPVRINSSDDDVRAVAEAFHASASEYIAWFERYGARNAEPISMRELHGLLARLQAAAAKLPAIAPSDDDDTNDSGASNDSERGTFDASNLPFDHYGLIFAPLDDSDVLRVVAMLANDLDDIYHDLQASALRFRMGEDRDALWNWHFSYYSHWGRHLSHAQTAIWQFLSEGNWE
jgi:hypothetical protein